MRALRADGRSRRAIWFLLIPLVVLAAWTFWFFEARIARYESSDRAGIVVSGAKAYVAAEFPAAFAIARIHPGETARVQIAGIAFAGRVARLDKEIHNGLLRVEIALDRAPSPVALQDGLPAHVEVEIETVSPATLLLRSAGMLRSAGVP